jgi:hypothetical protein
MADTALVSAHARIGLQQLGRIRYPGFLCGPYIRATPFFKCRKIRVPYIRAHVGCPETRPRPRDASNVLRCAASLADYNTAWLQPDKPQHSCRLDGGTFQDISQHLAQMIRVRLAKLQADTGMAVGAANRAGENDAPAKMRARLFQPAPLPLAKATRQGRRAMQQDVNMLAFRRAILPHPDESELRTSKAHPVPRQFQESQCRQLCRASKSSLLPVDGHKPIQRYVALHGKMRGGQNVFSIMLLDGMGHAGG